MLIDPRNKLPFYVGKGCEQRMYVHETETKSGIWNNLEKCKTIQEIWNADLNLQYKQIFVENSVIAFKKEKELIKKYGRRFNKSGILTNIHVGGSGGGNIGVPVKQYNKNGIFIAEYCSAAEAERKTKISRSVIAAVCRGEYKTGHGYQWKINNDPPIYNYTRKSGKTYKNINQYDKDGVFIKTYKTGYEAAKALNMPTCCASTITACCRLQKKSYKGFQWRFSTCTPPSSINLRRKKVEQYTQNGILLATFKSIADAVKTTKITTISKCCNGIHKQSGGYVWKFKQ